jgi:hypothetical protein
MTQLTIRWIRVVAIVINTLVFLRYIVALTFYSSAIYSRGIPALSLGQIFWFGLALVAPILAIVAIAGLTRTADSRMVGAATSS